MAKIKVLDAFMGSGKTQGTINMINKNTDKRYIFITPYLDEVERIAEACKSRNVKVPKNDESGKFESLESLVDQGACIACTHSLFSRYKKSTGQQIKKMGYTLIVDEVRSNQTL